VGRRPSIATVPALAPLSTVLSQTLVAHTIEIDNEFELRLTESGQSARVTSVVMWSNLLRFVGDGITVGDLPAATGLPKARVLSMLGGVERWRYVFVAPSPADQPTRAKRDGWGSSRRLRSDWVVRPTPAGRATQEIRTPLFDEIEKRWEQRFEEVAIDRLRSSLQAIVRCLDIELPKYLPIVASNDGMAAGVSAESRSESSAPHQLTALLAQALLAYTLDFESDAELSLPVSANFVRVLDRNAMLVRDVPESAGISKEAAHMALGFLAKTGYAELEGTTAATKRVRLTARGRAQQTELPLVHARVEAAWAERFGADELGLLRRSLDDVLEHPDLREGLRPHPTCWRASRPYLAHTEAMIENPRAVLPHYPLVLHRGGWPDGS
jgi:DNA-binding MarR family transcriptional regulator